MMRWTVAPLALVTLLAGSLWLAGVPVAAQGTARSATWNRFDVDLEVRRDGSLAVAERQEIAFRGSPPFRRGSRLVPTARTSGITDVSVAEVQPGGQEVPYTRGLGATGTFSTATTAQGLSIDWTFPDTSNATRAFVVRYVALGAIRLYDRGDQLNWDAVYADRAGDVLASAVTVRLPADVPPDGLTSALYRARPGDTLGARPAVGSATRVDARTVRFEVGALPPRTGAEVRVQFPSGLVAGPPPAWQAEADRQDRISQTVAPIGGFASLLVTALVLAGGGALLLFLWLTRGRDPGVGRVAPVLDRPPSDLPAPLAGTLVDEVADARDAVATLVDLAQRGVVTLTDVRNPDLVGSQQDVQIERRDGSGGARLRRYERTLLDLLFRGVEGNVVTLSSVRDRLAGAIPILQAQLHQAVAEEGLFHADPEATRQRFWRLGWVVVVLGVLLAAFAGGFLGTLVAASWLPGVALFLVGLGLVWLSRAMPRRTPRGALEAARWRAFRVTLERGNLPPNGRSDQYLPYAVAFGTDRTFLNRLDAVGHPPPAWYRRMEGPGGVVMMPGGFGWGGPPIIVGGGWGGPTEGPGTPAPDGAPGPVAPGGFGEGWSAPSPQAWSDGLADLLNSASEALASGGGSGDWSGGGFGGGGGGGGGSGGFD